MKGSMRSSAYQRLISFLGIMAGAAGTPSGSSTTRSLRGGVGGSTEYYPRRKKLKGWRKEALRNTPKKHHHKIHRA